jgi:hypothetical protein
LLSIQEEEERTSVWSAISGYMGDFCTFWSRTTRHVSSNRVKFKIHIHSISAGIQFSESQSLTCITSRSFYLFFLFFWSPLSSLVHLSPHVTSGNTSRPAKGADDLDHQQISLSVSLCIQDATRLLIMSAYPCRMSSHNTQIRPHA